MSVEFSYQFQKDRRMSWVKHDDGFSQNRKVAKLSDKAYRLHFCALEHCARNLTDGTLLDFELANVFAVAQIKRNALAYVAELVDADLWRTIQHGYEIHGYLEYNPSSREVKEQRKRNAERQKKHRDSKRNAVTNAVTNGVTNAVTNGVSHTAPSRPVPKELESQRPDELHGLRLYTAIGDRFKTDTLKALCMSAGRQLPAAELEGIREYLLSNRRSIKHEGKYVAASLKKARDRRAA
jgi:hypothetical protein